MLTGKEIEINKTKLLKLKLDIKEQLSLIANKEKGEDYKTKYPDYGRGEENAYEVSDYTSALPLEKQLERELKKINLALKKINKGDYGICEKCGKDIEKERLSIRPQSIRCIVCAKKS